MLGTRGTGSSADRLAGKGAAGWPRDEYPDADLGVSLLKVMEDVVLEARAREATTGAGKEARAAQK